MIKLESFLVLDVSYDETAIIQVRRQSSIGGPWEQFGTPDNNLLIT